MVGCLQYLLKESNSYFALNRVICRQISRLEILMETPSVTPIELGVIRVAVTSATVGVNTSIDQYMAYVRNPIPSP